jgi:hypothetical protein
LGPYVGKAGFIYDDWDIAPTYWHNDGGFLGALKAGIDSSSVHPISGLHTAFQHDLFGTNSPWQYVYLAALGVATSMALFAVLSAVGVPWVLAIAAAVLGLISPASDAGRLWVAGGGGQFAVLLLFAGAYAGVRAVRRPGVSGIPWHALGLALYISSLLTYDIAAPAIALSVLLYRSVAPWRRAVAHWLPDLGAVVICSLIVRAASPKDINTSSGSLLDRAHRILQDGVQLLGSNAGSLGATEGTHRVSWVIALMVVLASIAIPLTGLIGASRGWARTSWLVRAAWMGLGGLVLAAAGAAVLVVVQDDFTPLGVGIANRVNVLTGYGLAIAAVGVVATAVLLCTRRLVDAGSVVAIVVCTGIVVAVPYIWRLRSHEHLLIQSVDQQRAALDVLRDVDPPPRGSVVFVANVAGASSTSVPVFQAPWDIAGALEWIWGEPVSAVPAGTVDSLQCTAAGVHPTGQIWPASFVTAYGRAEFVDARSGRTARPSSTQSCRVLAQAFRFPGA